MVCKELRKGQSINVGTDKTLARIGALLARAEGTDSAHEADACVSRAQALATLHSIDLAVARAHTRERTTRTAPQQKTVAIGHAGRRGLKTFVDLFWVVAGANNVKIDIASNYTCVYTFGYPEDLAITELLYTHLVTQMVTACQAYLASGDYKPELVDDCDHDTHRPPRRVSKISARLEFHAAFIARIKTRLTAARQAATATVTAARRAGGAELVLYGKQLEVDDYYARTSQAKGRRYRGHQTGVQSQRSRAAGDRAATTAHLHVPTELAGATAALPGKRS